MYVENGWPTTLDGNPQVAATEGYEVYSVWGVDDDGVCLCPKREGCPDPGKHPATRNGIKDASSDPEKVAAMFRDGPGCNVGAATGVRSRVAALDWDGVGCGGAHRRLRELVGPLPPTRTHRSGSGNLHDLFVVPAGLDRLPSRTLIDGCELKADGAGILLPPSVTNWGRYEVLAEGPLAELPDSIIKLATSLALHEGGKERGTESRFALPERIYEGTRAWTLYRFACSLRAHGHDQAAILEELLRANAERCAPPLPDAEVRKAARSAARHAKGDATTVTAEALRVLASIEAAVLRSPWPGMGGGSERDVMIALVLAARKHGQAIPAGVRLSLDFRSLALAAGLSVASAHRAVQRLRRKGWLRYDNLGRRLEASGALVLVRTPEQSTTSLPPSEGGGSARATQSVSVTPCAPRLRWGRTLGKRCGAAVDALEAAGRQLTVKELAAAMGVKKASDVRRRYVARLVEARVVGYDEGTDTVWLRPDWSRALEERRMASGEKRREADDRRQYEKDRREFGDYLAERKEMT